MQSQENTLAREYSERRPFGKRDIIGYFFGDFGSNLSYSVVTYYLMIFYVSYIGIDPVHFSAIMLLTRVLDAVNDPVIGYMSDRMKPINGNKYKPWILVGGPFLALISAFMYYDSSHMAYGGRLLLCAVTYILWDLAYTLVNIPYGTLNSVISDKATERTKLSTARSVGAGVAKLPIALIPLLVYQDVYRNGQLVNEFKGERMFPVMIGLGFFALISFMILYFNVEERVKPKNQEAAQQAPFLETIKSLFANRPLLAQVIAGTAQTIFIYSASQLHQMTLQVKFNNGALFSWFTLIEIMPLALGIFIVTPLVRRFGKRRTIVYPLTGALVIYAAMLVLPIDNVWVWISLLALANAFTFGFQLLSWAMISDAVDYHEWKHGHRSDGSLYSSYIFCRKIGTALSSSMVPLLISFVAPTLQLNQSETWTTANVNAITNLSILFPLIGFALVYVAYRFVFNISDEDYQQMQRDLNHSDS